MHGRLRATAAAVRRLLPKRGCPRVAATAAAHPCSRVLPCSVAITLLRLDTQRVPHGACAAPTPGEVPAAGHGHAAEVVAALWLLRRGHCDTEQLCGRAAPASVPPAIEGKEDRQCTSCASR